MDLHAWRPQERDSRAAPSRVRTAQRRPSDQAVAAMTLDFTAIDFETANSYRGSPCSVGLVKVRDGQIADESFTLIHPPARFDHFDGFNTWLHGINAEMVAGARSWQQAADW